MPLWLLDLSSCRCSMPRLNTHPLQFCLYSLISHSCIIFLIPLTFINELAYMDGRINMPRHPHNVERKLVENSHVLHSH